MSLRKIKAYWDKNRALFVRGKKALAKLARQEAMKILRSVKGWELAYLDRGRYIVVAVQLNKPTLKRLQGLAPYTQPDLDIINPKYNYYILLSPNWNTRFVFNLGRITGVLEMYGTRKQIEKLLGYLPKPRKDK
jgi:hypothetical protein